MQSAKVLAQRSGQPLPPAELEVMDGLSQGPDQGTHSIDLTVRSALLAVNTLR